MTFFFVFDVDPLAAEMTKNDKYEDEKHCTVERPIKIKQSANQRNLARDSSPCGEQKTNKEGGELKRTIKIKQSANQMNLARDSSPCGEQKTIKESGELKRNAQIQAVRDCQGHRMSRSSRIFASSGPGRPPISSEYKGYRDNVQQHPNLNRNQTKPESFPLPNVRKLECKS
jgi:hypothetical protein